MNRHLLSAADLDRDDAILVLDTAGEEHPTGGDPQEHEIVGALGAFEDLVGDARERARDLGIVKDGAHVVRSPCSGHLCDPLPRLTGRT